MTVKPKRPFAKAPKRTCKMCEYKNRKFGATILLLQKAESDLASAEADKRILQQKLEAVEVRRDESFASNVRLVAERDALAQKVQELEATLTDKYKRDRTICQMQYSESKDSKKI